MQNKFPDGMTVESVFDKYCDTVYRLAYARVQNKFDAEDILQTVFLKLCREKCAFNDAEHLKAWLLKVCRNLYLNSLRRSKRITELDERLADQSETALEQIIRKEEYRALYHAISLLNSSYKEVITLFYFEDLSVKDIALVTGKSETVVKVTLFRGREALKKILSNAM